MKQVKGLAHGMGIGGWLTNTAPEDSLDKVLRSLGA